MSWFKKKVSSILSVRKVPNHFVLTLRDSAGKNLVLKLPPKEAMLFRWNQHTGYTRPGKPDVLFMEDRELVELMPSSTKAWGVESDPMSIETRKKLIEFLDPKMANSHVLMFWNKTFHIDSKRDENSPILTG